MREDRRKQTGETGKRDRRGKTGRTLDTKETTRERSGERKHKKEVRSEMIEHE